MAQEVRYGFMGKVDVAILEACEITPDGKVYLTAAGGIAPTIARLADKVIIELNAAHSKTVWACTMFMNRLTRLTVVKFLFTNPATVSVCLMYRYDRKNHRRSGSKHP